MKRFACLLLCAALAFPLFSGCTEGETPYVPTGDALVIGTETTPSAAPDTESAFSLAYYPDRSLNPYTSTDYTNRVLFSLLYQGLFTVDRNYEVTPVLCSSYSRSADMKSYTFRVEGATFSDGTAVTASDVAASLTAAKKSPYFSGRFQHVTAISVSDNGVTVKLDTPCENLPILLDVPIVKSNEVAAAQPLGTGPYVLDDTGAVPMLCRRQDWWCGGTLPVSTFFITLVPGENTPQIRDRFEYGQVSLVCANTAAADYADFRGDYELMECETGTFLYLVCNRLSSVFSDAALRQALIRAIDRDALVQTHYRGFARSAVLPASPQFPQYSTALAAQYRYDPQILTDALAGREQDGEEAPEVRLLVNTQDAQRLRAARSIAEMLTGCGLKVTLIQKAGKEFTEALEEGDYDLYLAQTRLSANMDLSAFFAEDGGLSYGGLADHSTYVLCLESLANSGNYYGLYEKIMENGWLCPLLFQSYAVYSARGAVSALTPSRDHLFFYTTGRTMADVFFKE